MIFSIHIGLLHEYGRGVPQNLTKAAILYREAASKVFKCQCYEYINMRCFI